MLDLAAALEAKRLSDREAGAEVLALWKRRARLSKYPTAESIAAKLGKLKKGDSTWWVNQPDALACLAELLRCNPADLIPAESRRHSAIGFREFPELAELLPGQDPCAVRGDVGWLGSFADAVLQQGDHAWVVAGAGAGKTLAVEVLRARHGARIAAVTSRRLYDAVRGAKEKLPLLVEVESPDEATDHGALVELTKRHTSVCILSPFRRPLTGVGDSGWTEFAWSMDRDWRERFLRWAQPRLRKPEDLDIDAVLDWLEAVDPRGVLFQTPGHLLPVLARAYRSELPRGSNALRDLGREALAQLLGADTRSWVRREGQSAVEHLLLSRLENLDVALSPLPARRWVELLPPSPQGKASEHRTAPKKRAKVAAPDDDGLQAPAASSVVAVLEDVGVLKTSQNGDLDLAPWVRTGIEREAIMARIKSDRLEWSAWAVDASRRDAVDDALDTLSPSDLVIAAQTALAADPKAFTTVAALEALFSALGRRMIDAAWEPPDAALPVLQELGKRQLALLAALPNVGTIRPLLPLTRHRPNQSEVCQAQWIAEAWTFSFAVKAPRGLASDPSWTLPGWSSDLRLSNAPRDLLPIAFAETPDDAVTYGRLLVAAREAVRACSDTSVADDIAYLLFPWVVIDGRERGWSIGEKGGALLVGSKLGNIIGELLKSEPKQVRRDAVVVAWNGALAERSGNPLYAMERLRDSAPVLADVLLAELPPEMFAAAFTPKVIEQADFTGRLDVLPPPLLRALLLAVADFVRSAGKPIHELADAVRALGQGDVDLLVEFAADKYNVGITATARVWELDPDRALHQTNAALKARHDSEAYAWFYSAPRARYAALLDALEEAAASSASWATRWLAEVLPVAGLEAPRVFGMMQLSIPT